MSNVIFRLIDELNRQSLSELARTKLLEGLEAQIDMDLYEKAMKVHDEKDESLSHQAMVRELGGFRKLKKNNDSFNDGV